MTNCELRKKAAKVIQTRGWHRGSFSSVKGAVCMLGALNTAAYGNAIGPSYLTPFSAVNALQRAVLSIGLKSIPKWNDRKGRTKAQVIAKLLKGCE